MDTPWIAVTGRDATLRQEVWINPAVVATVAFWNDRDGSPAATVELTTGSSIDLREPTALDELGRLTGRHVPALAERRLMPVDLQPSSRVAVDPPNLARVPQTR
jgi:hypothetical protein